MFVEKSLGPGQEETFIQKETFIITFPEAK